MTDQEIKEQIERDAAEYSKRYDHKQEPYSCEDYTIGAWHQDKIATNRTVEEVKALLDKTHFAHTGTSYSNFLKELEKLRRV
jgi:hypothetical protein